MFVFCFMVHSTVFFVFSFLPVLTYHVLEKKQCRLFRHVFLCRFRFFSPATCGWCVVPSGGPFLPESGHFPADDRRGKGRASEQHVHPTRECFSPPESDVFGLNWLKYSLERKIRRKCRTVTASATRSENHGVLLGYVCSPTINTDKHVRSCAYDSHAAW